MWVRRSLIFKFCSFEKNSDKKHATTPLHWVSKVLTSTVFWQPCSVINCCIGCYVISCTSRMDFLFFFFFTVYASINYLPTFLLNCIAQSVRFALLLHVT